MTSFQKVIKYIAFALAMLLTVTIISTILTLLGNFSFLLSGKVTDVVGEMQTYTIDGEISSLSIDINSAELKIQTADKFSVESNHKYISVKPDNGKLSIRETKKFFATSPKIATVILYIPENFVFGDAVIDTGAGMVEIDSLECDVLKISLGAGTADIKTLTANSRAEIDGGAGEIKIGGGKLCNLNLDIGVGKFTLKSCIYGESDIDCGVGETNLVLIGSDNEYKIKIDKGIGDARLSGENIKDGHVYGSGENFIEIDCGVGALSIEFSME